MPQKIKVIIGSTRPNRFGDKPGAWIAELAKAQEGFDVEVLDLRDYPMPFLEDKVPPSQVTGAYGDPAVQKWADKIAEADGFIVIAAEYNHGYTAVLKNAIDQVYKEWNHKAVAFVGYGGVGGARAVEQLREVVVELQMAPVRQAVHIMAPWMLTDGDALKPGALDQYTDAAKGMLTNLSWWTKALKAARQS
jgi:NAD(P)H-dependent FMN reductase